MCYLRQFGDYIKGYFKKNQSMLTIPNKVKTLKNKEDVMIEVMEIIDLHIEVEEFK